MSSSINVYAVDVERLKQIVASRDQALIDAIVAGHEDFLAGVDDIDEDAELTCADAVAELIVGELSDDAPGYLYGYAVQAICSHFGEELPSCGPISGASEWMEELDAQLESKGIPVRLGVLVYGGSPIPVPEPDDYPFIGKWTAAEIAAAKTALETADLSHDDPETAETLEQVRTWIDEAAKKPGVSIVGFLS